MFISPAYAQGAGGGLGGLEPLIPLILIFVVFYFLLIRPQQKKAKQHREMLSALRRGDKIVTSGGIVGTITKVTSDTELMLEIADNVRVRVMRNMVADVLTRPDPGRGGDGDGDGSASISRRRKPKDKEQDKSEGEEEGKE